MALSKHMLAQRLEGLHRGGGGRHAASACGRDLMLGCQIWGKLKFGRGTGMGLIMLFAA
jgi:hypothetical protein